MSAYQKALDERARELILNAFDGAQGNRTKTATFLGLDRRTFYREIARLKLAASLEKIAAEKGWEPRPGTFLRDNPTP